MSCARCKKARYAIQTWFYEVSGLRAIHDRMFNVIRLNHMSMCHNFNRLESNVVTLRRQVKAANSTLQGDYVKVGSAIDILERRIRELESPGRVLEHVAEPHKLN